MEEETVVTEETPIVESETTTPSTSEEQTATETVTPPADVSDQPDEVDKPPRAQKRIQELTHKVKELEEKASYWDQLNAVPPEVPLEDEDAPVTVDGIADAVLRKQQTAYIEQNKVQAQTAMAQDAAAAIAAHPDLETDDELADIVVAYAEKNRISFKVAADKIKARMNQEHKKAEAKVIASQAQRAGASTPTGISVSTGGQEPVNLTNMSDDQKEANWDKILASMV